MGLKMEYMYPKKELIKELMPEIEDRMEKKMKLIVMNVLKEMLEERKETYLAMKLSEDSFGRLWDNKEDEIWDKY